MSRSSSRFECSSGFSKSSVLPPVLPVGSPDPEGFSDDSGVDLRPQRRCSDHAATTGALGGESRKNKRKSSEPKKRKDVLQMKRFQWDSEDEDEDEDGDDGERVMDGDSDDVFEDGGERPSSGDSGFQSGTAENHIPLTESGIRCLEQHSRVSESKEELSEHRKVVKTESGLYEHRTVGENLEHDKEERQRRRRPPRSKQARVSSQDESRVFPPVLRQSVIKKHDSVSLPSTSAVSQSCVLSSPTASSSLNRLQPVSVTPSQSDVCYPLDLGVGHSTATTTSDSSRSDGGPRSAGRPRNYKSMSRQRRIEANARERSRVHTISAAFESLRRAVPAYAHNQKLSKLAILRIASAYIVALGCLNEQQGCDKQRGGPSLSECVDQCTRTIQAEGRTRRRTKE